MRTFQHLRGAWTEDSTVFAEFTRNRATTIEALTLVLLVGLALGTPQAAGGLMGGEAAAARWWLIAPLATVAIWAGATSVAFVLARWMFHLRMSWRVILTALGFAATPLIAVVALSFNQALSIFALIGVSIWVLFLIYVAFNSLLDEGGLPTVVLTLTVPFVSFVLWLFTSYTVGTSAQFNGLLWGPAVQPPCYGDVDATGHCIPADDLPVSMGPPRWGTIPEIVISARPDDPRIPAARDAVAFWNTQLETMGTPFRLGEVSVTEDLLSTDFVETIWSGAYKSTAPPDRVPALATPPGRLVIAMSTVKHTSFSVYPRRGNAVVAVITSPPGLDTLGDPSLARNVIAHELGHAIGLRHNDNMLALMCGRPAVCDDRRALMAAPGFMRLTQVERSGISQLYAANWKPSS